MTKRDLVTRMRKQADDYAKLADDYAKREKWDEEVTQVTRSDHWRAMAEMASQHAMELDTAK